MTGEPRTDPGPLAVVLFALATFGAHLAYTPLLALLLPRRIVAIAPGHAATTLSVVILTGAITASVAHILAGRISDTWRARHGDRRAPIAAGLVLTVLALAGMGLARDWRAVLGGLIAVQIALNLMFAPLGALLVDHFPDHRKGRGAAFANLTMPLAGMGTGVVALLFPHDGPLPFVLVAGLVAISIAPLVLVWPFAPAAISAPMLKPADRRVWPRDLARAGLARLLVQFGAAFIVTYFYLYVVRHPDRIGAHPGLPVDRVYGRLVLATTGAVLVVTVLAGHWSDRAGARRVPMIIAALVAGTALAVMPVVGAWAFMAGFALFQTGLIAYLALDAAMVAQLLSRHDRSGEMLGFMNLANTLPSIVVPGVVLALSHGAADPVLAAGFAACALCCVAAAALVRSIGAVA